MAKTDTLKEYREKLARGEVERPKGKTPFERWEEDKLSLRKSITAECFDCSNEQKFEITNCRIETCRLWHVRPYQKKN